MVLYLALICRLFRSSICIAATGFDIQVLQSPAQSPDMSVFDQLVAYEAFGSAQDWCSYTYRSSRCRPGSWDEYDWETLDGAWGCLISTYQRILNDEGGNEFRTPHNGVRRKQAMGVYVCDVPIDIVQIDRLQLLIDAYFHVNP